MRKPLLALLSTCVLLAGCGSSGSTSKTFSVEFDDIGQSNKTMLIEATKRVLERRVRAIEGLTPDVLIDIERDAVSFNVTVDEAETMELLIEHVTKPYSLALMRTTEEGETPDLYTDAGDHFIGIGFTQEHVHWVEHGTDESGKGKVTIRFRDADRTRLRSYFTENVGKRIGLFSRDALIAVYVIQEDDSKENIVISGIPDAELAEIFADDVNVGTHVRFTPL